MALLAARFTDGQSSFCAVLLSIYLQALLFVKWASRETFFIIFASISIARQM